MKVAFFDCQFGAAGDMLCASLAASGLDLERWQEELGKIALPEGSFEVAVEDVLRCLIAAKKVTVKCSKEIETATVAQEHDEHDHGHHHETHEHHHSPGSHGRSIREIVALIDASAISSHARQLSKEIFHNLAIAEGRVHGVAPADVHFHEVGAIDAIVDVVGFAIAYDLLGIEKSIVSPLTAGSGTVKTQHGLYPVPGPATAYLIERAGAPTNSLDIRFECLTPTGAAILTTIASAWGAQPAFQKIDSVGYGAGTLDPATHPNVVRVYIGQCSEPSQALLKPSQDAAESQFRVEVIAVIEANIDDCPPNIIAYALEKALGAGALDISIVPATMKKGRSGHLVTVLAKPEDRRKLEALILRETSTLGVRSYLVERLVAEREFAEVKLSDSWSIRVKVGRDLNGNIINVQPEYADCATYAQRHGLTLREVFEQALNKFLQGC